MTTIWSKSASTQLQKAHDYIRQFSPQNADKVRDEIVDLTIALAGHPEQFPLDKYKAPNDGSYRAFELHRYRITYRIVKR